MKIKLKMVGCCMRDGNRLIDDIETIISKNSSIEVEGQVEDAIYEIVWDQICGEIRDKLSREYYSEVIGHRADFFMTEVEI